jgi:ribose transport system substrate-binding protein
MAHSKNIPVGSSAQGVAPSPSGFAFDVGANWSEVGRLQGNWIVADSKGKGDFLPMIDKEYASVVASVKAAEDVVKSCSSCTVEGEQSFVGSNVGNGLGQRVVGVLRSNPKIDYVDGTYDPASADIATGIANSGIGSDVKLIGQIGLHLNFNLIREGRGQTADVAFDQVYTGYATVDQLIRLMTHKPLFVTPSTDDPRYKYGEDVPIKLITKANVPAPGHNYEAPIGAVQHFHALWGLG